MNNPSILNASRIYISVILLADRDRTGIIDVTQQVGNETRLVGQYLPDHNGSDHFFVKGELIAEQFDGKVPVDGSQSE